MSKKILFLTGTRADFSKIKTLLIALRDNEAFTVQVFITGMHMLKLYGHTYLEVERLNIERSYRYINQNANDSMDIVLSKTINGLSDYIKEDRPDLIIVHGDRVEALAGAIVGSLNNIRVAHIEGGEVSGTIDELIRHAVSKMSHYHFVSNEAAKNRLIQLGERKESIKVVGSPDIDIMYSNALPTLKEVKNYYNINFESYAIVLYHPVTTEVEHTTENTRSLIDAILKSRLNYVVVYPNNDHGAQEILTEYERLESNSAFKLFPSMRFEYFLTLMKHCRFMIGNSSAGIREAPIYGIPSINIGSRQNERGSGSSIINSGTSADQILQAIQTAMDLPRKQQDSAFGEGDSYKKFVNTLLADDYWNTPLQKFFVDNKI